jgi:hypothetical protein
MQKGGEAVMKIIHDENGIPHAVLIGDKDSYAVEFVSGNQTQRAKLWVWSEGWIIESLIIPQRAVELMLAIAAEEVKA